MTSTFDLPPSVVAMARAMRELADFIGYDELSHEGREEYDRLVGNLLLVARS